MRLLGGIVMLALITPSAGCGSPVPARQGQIESRNTADHIVQLPSGTLRIPLAEWKPMRNEYEWAENFEQVLKGPRHTVPRVVTVFKLPMSDDRKTGVKISPNEYLEMFVVNPGSIDLPPKSATRIV